MKRYGNLDFIKVLDSETLIELLKTAIEKEVEEKLWERWLAELPGMSFSGKFIPFDEYKRKLTKTKTENKVKDEDEIIKDAENILKSMGRKK